MKFIIPLAALVGAPLCDKFPKDTKEINELYIKQLSDFVDEAIKIIMPTTNSGYGVAKKEKICTEKSPLNPISLYGVTKVNAEKIIMKRKNSISLRLATVFGYSERMRLDLLVNTFAYKAIKEKKIEIFEGKFKRNFIYIDDVVNVFVYCIENFDNLKSNIYNFGIEGANLTKIELVEVIKKFVPDFKFIINEFSDDPDKRDYIVSNKKILETGFNFSWDLESAIEQLILDLKKLPPEIIRISDYEMQDMWSKNLDLVFDLGNQPWGNNFLKFDEIGKEKNYPLELLYCNNCNLSQLSYTVKKK